MTNQNEQDESIQTETEIDTAEFPMLERIAASTGFKAFHISSEIMKAVTELGFTEPTEIQAKTIPYLLAEDGDLIALASTGSGKTAAFGIPLIEQVDPNENKTQGLVLCPTRELALQVSEQIQKLSRYKKVSVATIFGGGSYTPQEKALRKGPQIIVATPGRLIDFIDQGLIDLKQVEILILDEADEMISLGFKEALETILSETADTAKKWMFSATMDRSVRSIADHYLNSPHEISQNKSAGLSDTIEQVYMTVRRENRAEALLRIIETNPEFYGIVFCQTKLEVADLTEKLLRNGLKAGCIHGDLKQGERTAILKKFKDKDVKVMIATDVAARGIDVKDLTHVVNHSLPWDVESYIHRIGRTARNGKKGTAISLISPEQVKLMARIIKTTGKPAVRQHVPRINEIKEVFLKKMLPNFFSGAVAKGENLEELKTMIRKVSAELEIDIENITAEDLLVKILGKQVTERFAGQKDDLDYLPADRAPRELSGEKGGSSSYRSSGGFERGERSDRRGGRGGGFDRRSRGGERPRFSEFKRAEGDRPYRAEGGRPDRAEGGRSERAEGGRPARTERTEGSRPSRFSASDRPRRTEGDRPVRAEGGRSERAEGGRSERTEGGRRPPERSGGGVRRGAGASSFRSQAKKPSSARH